MSDDLVIGVVATPRQWRGELQSHVRNHVSGVRLTVLREARAAFEEEMDVVVVDDVASVLNRLNLKRLRERGVRVVGVYDPEEDEGAGRRFLEDLGVDLAVTADATAEELLEGIASLGPAVPAFDPGEIEDFLAEFAQPAAPARETEAPAPPAGEAGSSLIVVGGAPGAGATEVAIGLAGALVARRERTVLLDLDAAAPSVARRLCYELDPNILSAVDAHRHGTAPLGHQLGVRADRAPGFVAFDAVPGLANVGDWPDLRDTDVLALLDELRSAWAHVVVDAGSHLEDLDAGGPERHGAARAAVAVAEQLVAVCPPTPLGLLRLLDWAALAHELAPTRAITVVVNQAPRSRYRRGQLESQLRNNVAPELLGDVIFVPSDDRVSDGVWDGAPVAKGAFAAAMRSLAARTAPERASAGRRRTPLTPSRRAAI